MLILAPASKAEKSYFDKYYKVIISDVIYEDDFGNIVGYDGEDQENVITTREFLPDPIIFANFTSGYFGKKKFIKKYWKEIYENKERLSSLMMILIAYRKGKKIALVCDDSEVDYGYLGFLGKIISERYGIELGSFKDVKNKNTKKNKIKHEDILDEDIRRCKKELKEIGNYSVKKKKKKKDKDKDKKKKKKKKEKMHFTYYNNKEEADGFNDRVKIVTIKPLFSNKVY